MPPKKATSAVPSRTPPSQQSAPSTGTTPTSRKPWVKKTPVEVVLEQIYKQEQKVAEMREEINHEERELSKLQQAKKVLESA
jgi:hypothetical protein